MGWFVYIDCYDKFGGMIVCGPLSKKLSDKTIAFHLGDKSAIRSISQKWHLFTPDGAKKASSESEIDLVIKDRALTLMGTDSDK